MGKKSWNKGKHGKERKRESNRVNHVGSLQFTQQCEWHPHQIDNISPHDKASSLLHHPDHRLTPIQQHRSSSCVKQTKQQWSIFWRALNSALLSSLPHLLPPPVALCFCPNQQYTILIHFFPFSSLSPFIVACSTVTVTKCQAALRTLQAFPFFRPTCLCKEPSVDPDCNYFRDFLFDHPCGFVLKKGKPWSWKQKESVVW